MSLPRMNYLKATSCEVGLLLNFGPQPQVKRKAFDRQRHNQGSLNPEAVYDPR